MLLLSFEVSKETKTTTFSTSICLSKFSAYKLCPVEHIHNRFICNSFVMSYVGVDVRMGKTVSAFDSSVSWVGVSRCEVESSNNRFTHSCFHCMNLK